MTSKRHDVYGGTSGYSFREWVGLFYPKRCPSKEYLGFYASRLNSVEINHTFRRFPTLERTRAWADSTPESFRFSIKMHQSVTHRARLRDVRQSVADFTSALAPLGPRRGVVLFQLPPFLRIDLARLKELLRVLPGGLKYALEFRHESWQEPQVVDLLRDSGTALCAGDFELDTSVVPQTAAHAYLRFRKVPPYEAEEEAQARSLIEQLARKQEEVYFYVKHDDLGRAPETVLSIQRS